MKKSKKKIVLFLLEITYFVPDIVGVLAVLSLFHDFGGYKVVVSSSLFIAYIALTYGERYLHRLVLSKEMIDKVTLKLEDMAVMLSDTHKKYVTFNGMVRVVEILEDDYNKKIEELRNETRGDVVIGEVDKEK